MAWAVIKPERLGERDPPADSLGLVTQNIAQHSA